MSLDIIDHNKKFEKYILMDKICLFASRIICLREYINQTVPYDILIVYNFGKSVNLITYILFQRTHNIILGFMKKLFRIYLLIN